MFRLVIALFGAFGLTMKASAIGLPTSEVAIVGTFGRGPVDFAFEVDESSFDLHYRSDHPEDFPAEVQALQFFRNGGDRLSIVRVDSRKPLGLSLKGSLEPSSPTGLGALLPLSNLGVLICPELAELTDQELGECLGRIEVLGEERPLFTILDPPSSVSSPAEVLAWRNLQLSAAPSHVAVYYPKLRVDPAAWEGSSSAERLTVGASGSVAAFIQQNDASRGIWKAPAGSAATIISEGLTVNLSNPEIENLNQAGINTLRNLPTFGDVIWGSRTLDSDPENRYLPVARTRRWITRSLQRELADAALSSNNSILWASLEFRAEAFMETLFRQGAFAGATSKEAYFVKCDMETTTAQDIAEHRVNLFYGCAFLRVSEFTVDQISFPTLNESQASPELPIQISQEIDGMIYVSFPTVPGFVHRLQTSTNLRGAFWSGGVEIAGDGSWQTVFFPGSSPRMFFRVNTGPGW